MKKFYTNIIAISAASSLVATSLGASAAFAGENNKPLTSVEILTAIENLERLDDSLILEPLKLEKTKNGTKENVSESHTSVKIPIKSNENIVFTNQKTRESVNIRMLKDAENPALGEANIRGMLSYISDSSAANTVVPIESGVQILTTIIDSNAPTNYTYEYDLKAGERFEKQDDGSVYAIDSDGEIANIIEAPWAIDAQGSPVATSYEVEGNHLIQIIDHAASETVVYPVVADPIWLAPWVVRCLVGIGLNGPQIVAVASKGTYWSILSAFGYAAVRCVFGR